MSLCLVGLVPGGRAAPRPLRRRTAASSLRPGVKGAPSGSAPRCSRFSRCYSLCYKNREHQREPVLLQVRECSLACCPNRLSVVTFGCILSLVCCFLISVVLSVRTRFLQTRMFDFSRLNHKLQFIYNYNVIPIWLAVHTRAIPGLAESGCASPLPMPG